MKRIQKGLKRMKRNETKGERGNTVRSEKICAGKGRLAAAGPTSSKYAIILSPEMVSACFGNLLIVPGMQRKKEEQKYLEVRIDKVRASTQNISCFCRLSSKLKTMSPDPGENVGDDLWLTNYNQVNEILGMVPPLVHGRDVSRMVSASCLQSIRAIHISGHIRTSRVPQSDSHYLIAMND
jgi:hypothetical protein